MDDVKVPAKYQSCLRGKASLGIMYCNEGVERVEHRA